MARIAGFLLQHCDNALGWTLHLSIRSLVAHSQRVVIARIAQVDGSNGSMTAVLRLVLAYPLSYRLWLHHFFGCGKALEDVHEA